MIASKAREIIVIQLIDILQKKSAGAV